MKTFKIVTFGCRVNQAESRLMGEVLVKSLNCRPVKNQQKTDLVIINTCCVTQRAEKEVRQAISKVRRKNPGCFLVVCGCLINKIRNEKISNKKVNLQSLKKADLLLTNEQKKNFTCFGPIVDPRSWTSNRNFKGDDRQGSGYRDKYAESKKALVKIQTGCDNFCTYCLVPYVRGRSKSRPAEEIIEEIQGLIKQGIEEVVLTGVDIASFKFQIINDKLQIKKKLQIQNTKNNLVQLVKLILKTKIKRISFGSISLGVFEGDEFISLSRSWSGRLTTHFHIPLQSGSDSVLKRMKRPYQTEEFINKIEELKEKIRGFSFSTDVIVGFPGETRKEFEQTVKTVKKLKEILGDSFTHVHVFRYSPREGTVAAKKAGQKGWEKVPSQEKKRRSKVIREIEDCT